MDFASVVISLLAISTTTHGNTANSKHKCIFTGLTNIVLYKYPPFVLDTSTASIRRLQENGQISGVKSKKALECFLQPCLGSTNISTVTERHELIRKLSDNKTSIIYPVPLEVYNEYYSENISSTTDNSRDYFVPVRSSKTQARFVNIENCKTDLSHVIFSMIYKQWPIFTLMLLLAGIAGIIVWFLESRENTEEFATSFFPGGFDGFWWAFISMTTVGYGDKTPRSLFGRVFSILWIFLGITTVSFFTATITSAITIATVKNSCEEIENRTIAVLSLQSKVKSYVENNGGEAKEYSITNMIQMFDELNNEKNKISSMLIDVALANHYTDELSKRKNIKKVKAVELSQTDKMFYIMIRSNNSTSCFSGDYQLDNDAMSNHSNKQKVEYAVLEEEVVQPLSLESPETWPFMYTLVVGLVGLIILGTVQDMLLRLRRRHRSKSLHDGASDACESHTLYKGQTINRMQAGVDVIASSSSESSALIYQTQNALGALSQEMKEIKGLMHKTIERLANIEKLVESNGKQE